VRPPEEAVRAVAVGKVRRKPSASINSGGMSKDSCPGGFRMHCCGLEPDDLEQDVGNDHAAPRRGYA